MGTKIVLERICEANPAYTGPNCGVPEMLPPKDIQHVVTTTPLTLSATAFNKYVASALGGGDIMTGADAFQTIMDKCQGGQGRVKFCYTQYSKAVWFDKAEVDIFTASLVAGNVMSAQQRTTILDNWPEQ